jgi:hypothetical protein
MASTPVASFQIQFHYLWYTLLVQESESHLLPCWLWLSCIFFLFLSTAGAPALSLGHGRAPVPCAYIPHFFWSNWSRWLYPRGELRLQSKIAVLMFVKLNPSGPVTGHQLGRTGRGRSLSLRATRWLTRLARRPGLPPRRRRWRDGAWRKLRTMILSSLLLSWIWVCKVDIYLKKTT